MLLITFLYCLIVRNSFSYTVRYDNYKIYSITPNTPNTPQAVDVLFKLDQDFTPGYNFWSTVRYIGQPIEIMVSPNKIIELQELVEKTEMVSRLLTENVQERIDAEVNLGYGSQGEFGWTRFNTLDEINEWLRSLPNQYPSIVSLIELNETYEGRPIVGVKVSYGTRKHKRSVFVESNMHGREWISSATSTYILNQLLTSWDPDVRELAESHIWYFFPISNPDGFQYSLTEDRMWRKTRVPYTEDCIGADPNRNWDSYWGAVGTSNNPCSEIFHGPRPFSEPCTRILSDFIRTVGKDLVAYISFHSFSQFLMIPYGFTREHLDNYNLTYFIGQKVADVLYQKYGTVYRVGTVSDIVYPASGISTDWVKATFGTPIVYAYELRDKGQYGFQLPPHLIIPTAEETLDSFIAIFKEYYKAIET